MREAIEPCSCIKLYTKLNIYMLRDNYKILRLPKVLGILNAEYQLLRNVIFGQNARFSYYNNLNVWLKYLLYG
jgi:hypothetical protein